MKKVFLLALILSAGLSYTVNAQIRKLPAEVTNSFSEKYPDAKDVEWKDKLSNFSAGFEWKDEKYEAHFNKKGEWLSTDKEIDINDLPAKVKDGFDKSKYSDWETNNVYRIDMPDDKINYRVHVSKSTIQKKILLFNEKGKLLKDNLTL
jgi:hypothetical protein